MNKNLQLFFILMFFSLFRTLMISAQSDTIIQNEDQLYRFAKFLKNEKEYKFATEEFERLNFLYPNKINYVKELLYCARLNGDFDRIALKFKIDNHTSRDIIFEYALGLVGAEKRVEAVRLLKQSGIQNDSSFTEKVLKVIYAIDLLDGKKVDDNYLLSDNELRSLTAEYVTLPSKSTFKAGLLSSMIPGSGRVYTKDWKNGILGFLFIAGTGWQSYSRFKKSGISSAGGWIYGGLSFGFYLGNIYGSVVSARKYNQLHKKRIDEKTHRYLSSLSF